VTVSIALDSSGIFIPIDFVTFVVVLAVEGSTVDAPGTNKTSSKVSASRISINQSPWVVSLARRYRMNVQHSKVKSGNQLTCHAQRYRPKVVDGKKRDLRYALGAMVCAYHCAIGRGVGFCGFGQIRHRFAVCQVCPV
jgi:hypothetical protein